VKRRLPVDCSQNQRFRVASRASARATDDSLSRRLVARRCLVARQCSAAHLCSVARRYLAARRRQQDATCLLMGATAPLAG
jgi:hypothetical protein